MLLERIPKARIHLLVCVLRPVSLCCEAELQPCWDSGQHNAPDPSAPEGAVGPFAAPLGGSSDLS